MMERLNPRKYPAIKAAGKVYSYTRDKAIFDRTDKQLYRLIKLPESDLLRLATEHGSTCEAGRDPESRIFWFEGDVHWINELISRARDLGATESELMRIRLWPPSPKFTPPSLR
jgi:hypothetical protein